jgi:hypothetical protein
MPERQRAGMRSVKRTAYESNLYGNHSALAAGLPLRYPGISVSAH